MQGQNWANPEKEKKEKKPIITHLVQTMGIKYAITNDGMRSVILAISDQYRMCVSGCVDYRCILAWLAWPGLARSASPSIAFPSPLTFRTSRNRFSTRNTEIHRARMTLRSLSLRTTRLILRNGLVYRWTLVFHGITRDFDSTL